MVISPLFLMQNSESQSAYTNRKRRFDAVSMDSSVFSKSKKICSSLKHHPMTVSSSSVNNDESFLPDFSRYSYRQKRTAEVACPTDSELVYPSKRHDAVPSTSVVDHSTLSEIPSDTSMHSTRTSVSDRMNFTLPYVESPSAKTSIQTVSQTGRGPALLTNISPQTQQIVLYRPMPYNDFDLATRLYDTSQLNSLQRRMMQLSNVSLIPTGFSCWKIKANSDIEEQRDKETLAVDQILVSPRDINQLGELSRMSPSDQMQLD